MSDFKPDDSGMLDEVPRHDMLSVKFRGDDEMIVLPYCEVANGEISKIDTIERHIIITTETKDPITMTFESFVKVVQETFDIKDVVQLQLQQANSYDNIKIL
jgi:hypothetical protein